MTDRNLFLDDDTRAVIEVAADNGGIVPDAYADSHKAEVSYLQTWGVLYLHRERMEPSWRLTDLGVQVAAEHGWTVAR